MACLDTSLLIDLCRRNPARRLAARDKIRELGRRGEALAVTRFNVAELLVGMFRSLDPVRERQSIDTVLMGLEILEFSDQASLVFARMTAHLLEMRKPAGDMDVLVAATAVASGRSIVVSWSRGIRIILPNFPASPWSRTWAERQSSSSTRESALAPAGCSAAR